MRRGIFKDVTGNVAMMFALFGTMLLLGSGGAIDFWRRAEAATDIQHALDSAALAAARNVKKSEIERQAIAESMFYSSLESSGFAGTATPNITFTPDSVIVSVDYQMPTSLLKAVSVPTLPITQLTEAVSPGLGNAEFVFVLDYSSSMNSKYTEMRDAAIELINIISEEGTNPYFKFGIVPFAREVYATMDGAYVLGGVPGVPWSNCTRDRRFPFNISDETPIAANDDSKWGRTDSDDVIDPDEYDNCGPYVANNLEIMDLTDSYSDTISKLNAMTPHEGTNIALGVEFGMHLLSPNPPWVNASEYDDDDVRKFILILSDGRHNKEGFGPAGASSEEIARNNMQSNCDAMKLNGVRVITVAYDLSDSEGKAELEACAGGSGYYFEGDEHNIVEQFEAIGEALLAEVAYLKR